VEEQLDVEKRQLEECRQENKRNYDVNSENPENALDTSIEPNDWDNMAQSRALA
jgi:hypothetical protein